MTNKINWLKIFITAGLSAVSIALIHALVNKLWGD